MMACMAILAIHPIGLIFASYILGLINELSYICHMCALRLNYSESLLDLFRIFFPISNFDFLPTDDLYETIFNISE